MQRAACARRANRRSTPPRGSRQWKAGCNNNPVPLLPLRALQGRKRTRTRVHSVRATRPLADKDDISDETQADGSFLESVRRTETRDI